MRSVLLRLTPFALLLTLFPAGATSSSPQPPVAPSIAAALAGEWEGEAQRERWPLFLTLRLEESAGTLGGRIVLLGRTFALHRVTVRGNAVTAAVGEDASALVVAGEVRGDAFVGELREGEAVLRLTLRRVPDYPPAADRTEGWRQDLDALEHRFLAVDRSFSPGERLLFIERLAALRARLEELSDAEVVMGMASAIALGGNAHSRLYILRNRTELRRLPLRLWWFSDGLRVVRAVRAHSDLLGCRVDAVAGVDARHARDRVAPAFAGNPSWTDYMSVSSLTSPEALHGMGIAPDPERIVFTLSDCPAAGEVAVAPLPLVRSTQPVESWWDLSPRRAPADPDWVQVLAEASEVPLYLRDPIRYYWFDYLPGSGLLYFQYNRASQWSEEDTAAFAERLLAAFDAHPVRALVVDLRFNTGGDLGLGRPLMEALEQRSRAIPRFVVTGRATFSAGISHAAFWREAGSVTIVGEPVGDDLDFWSEGGNIVLPWSGLAAHFANGAHSYSTAPCPEGVGCLDLNSPSLRPDLPATATWTDYSASRDPALDAILRRLEPSARPVEESGRRGTDGCRLAGDRCRPGPVPSKGEP